jgi:hypothetical protein
LGAGELFDEFRVRIHILQRRLTYCYLF